MACARWFAFCLSTLADAYLRKKIDEGSSEKLIHTVRGAGYRIGSSLAPRQEHVPSPDRAVPQVALEALASSNEKSSC